MSNKAMLAKRVRRWAPIVLMALAFPLLAEEDLGAQGRTGIVYVTNGDSGSISVIDRAAMEVTADLKVDEGPHNVALSPDGKLLLVTHPSVDKVTLIQTATMKVRKRISIQGKPHGVAFAPDGTLAYERSSKILLIDPDMGTVERGIRLDRPPHNVAAVSNGKVWVTSPASPALWLIDPRTGRVHAQIPIKGVPHDLAVSPNGNGLWVTDWQSSNIFFIENTEGAIPSVIQVGTSGNGPHHLAATPDSKEVWISNHRSDDVTVVDALARKELMRIGVGKRPHHVAFSPGGRYAYVANSDSDNVTIIDSVARKVTGRVRVGKKPHGIAAN